MAQAFEVKSNIKDVMKWASDNAKQLPFAISLALNDTARQIKDAEILEMKKTFDKPTPYTLNALQITPARKGSLVAEVWFKNGSYLIPHVKGGSREQKKSEHWLSPYMGGQFRFYTPGMGARLNQYGNISPGMITQILSVLKVGIDPYSYSSARSRKRNKRLPEYFAAGPYISSKTPYPRTAHLQPGIYQRVGKRIKPVLIFVSHVNYPAIFDFYGVAQKVFYERFPANFDRAFEYAVRTAK